MSTKNCGQTVDSVAKIPIVRRHSCECEPEVLVLRLI